ncbi:unnamed protein product [Didymodactylos carnosus]|uniref:Uncharacterized protein n=1 Tax=Didymodactylos carnosus TaxID=1234261 RepID=A0A813QT69_9BILA|nr:unnamed protein product [Didymodactylos carnosus]CAF0791482.1 unnamed protein product [Didymodactylos carnosus]CAF3553352.1 unnamed protein product [Didymodactylos carnosus]CAF3574090.1 unnamed protein product [Didymodactylos carnosus]
MPRIQYIGQVSKSFGNTLPELCSKLKNFGIGRMFIRTAHDQDREVSYIILTKSRPVITKTPPKVIIAKLDEIAKLTQKVEDTVSTFYGITVENGEKRGEMKLSGVTNPDWRLIPKANESYYLKNTFDKSGIHDLSKTVSIQAQRFIDIPPLLSTILNREQTLTSKVDVQKPIKMPNKLFSSDKTA